MMKETGVDGVKLEGGEGISPPDPGHHRRRHSGLRPCGDDPAVLPSAFGGFTVQGKGEAGAARLLKDALTVQEAGAFAVVLECVPPKLAALISRKLDIITIGIGAGGGL